MTILTISLALAQMIFFLGGERLQPYSWHEVHADWNYARLTPSDGILANRYYRWSWIALGYSSFITLGMGDEVRKQYQDVLTKIGLGRFLKLRGEGGITGSSERSSNWVSSVGSRAKLLFSKGVRKSSLGSGSL
jgi:hypothetical protein